jgi:hypothetical protein
MGNRRQLLMVLILVMAASPSPTDDKTRARVYENKLTPVSDASPILADYPEYVEPVKSKSRFQAPALVDDPKADLHVRAWRFSYNARAVIEVPNHLSAAATAVIVVHPWGIDDGQGWRTPQPAGVAFACTPEKNRLALQHMKNVVNPFLQKWRGKVGLLAYSLPGPEDPIRKKLYRSVRRQPSQAERRQGAVELAAKLKSFSYKGKPLPARLTLSQDRPVVDYFKQFPGLDSGPVYNNTGFWDLPIPVAKPIKVAPTDVVFYDAEGYATIKGFLNKLGIRHILLAGYATDMCVCSTAAGYKNLSKDFNTFLVGDATQATFPSCDTPRFATTAAISFAALNLFITQVSWIKPDVK